MRHFLLRDQATQAVAAAQAAAVTEAPTAPQASAAAQAAGGPSDGSLLGAEGTAHTRAS